jgi:hypothetical protein
LCRIQLQASRPENLKTATRHDLWCRFSLAVGRKNHGGSKSKRGTEVAAGALLICVERHTRVQETPTGRSRSLARSGMLEYYEIALGGGHDGPMSPNWRLVVSARLWFDPKNMCKTFLGLKKLTSKGAVFPERRLIHGLHWRSARDVRHYTADAKMVSCLASRGPQRTNET